MLFLGLGLLHWTALVAIAGFLLAAAAIATIIVTVCLARADRRRDGTRRQEDREHDDSRRAEDRQWDSERRKEDRDHDAELRRQDASAKTSSAAKTTRSGNSAAAPSSASGKMTTLSSRSPLNSCQAARGARPVAPFSTRTTASPTGTSSRRPPSTRSSGWTRRSLTGRTPVSESSRRLDLHGPRHGERTGALHVLCGVPPQTHDAMAIVRFADRNGNLYYSFRGCTRRFPQNSEFIDAAAQLDGWIRTGPKPDEPDS